MNLVYNRSLVVVFAAQPEHALHAVQCASKLHAEVRSFTESRVTDGKRAVKLRVGIGTGDALSQTYGLDAFQGSSHIGSCVAQAQVLSGIAPAGQTILSGNTYSTVQEHISCRLVREVRLPDYDETVKAYEALSAEEAAILEAQKDNRRKYPRLELNLPVTLQVDQWSHRAEAINISAGGVLVACKDSFQPNTAVKLSRRFCRWAKKNCR